MSKIKVNEIEKASGSGITVPTGTSFTITDGLAVSSLPTVTVAKGGTNLTSFTAGDLLYATDSTTLAKLPKGTAAQVLKMNAGATAPEWGNLSSDFVFLSTTTISSSVAQVDIDYDSTYKEIFHFIEGIQCTADTDMYARFKIGGSINTQSAYSSNTVKKYYNGFDSGTYGGNDQSYLYLTNNVGGDTYESWSAQLRVIVGSGTGMPMIDITAFYKTAAGKFDANFGAVGFQNFNQVQGIRLYPSTGNFDTGKIHTYGVK